MTPRLDDAASRRGRWVPCLAVAICASASAQTADTFADLAPILGQRCVVCHAGEAAPMGLRLDSFEAVINGSSRGPVVKAGDPAGSELVRRLKGVSQPRMPMTGPPFLSDEEIARFERWVRAGLPRGAAAAAGSPAVATASAAAARPAPGEPVTYRHVAPLFATRCAKCHTDNGLMGPAPEGYRLTSHASTLASAERARVVPGRPEASELVRRIRGQARPRMPFDGPPYMSGDEIQLIEDWVAQGARDAEGKPAPLPVGAAVRLHGTWDANRRLDGLELVLGARTRLDKSPPLGSYVEVRGRLDAAGGVGVERLRPR